MTAENQIKETANANAGITDLHAQLHHAERLATVGQLAAGIAHELNGPLGNILGYAQLASKHPDLPDQLYADLDHIVRFALHAREIVRKVMLFSRQVLPKQESLSLNQVLNDGLYLTAPLLEKTQVAVTTHLNDNLPLMKGDPGQLRQVLVNLIVNAVQAMPDGGQIEITTRMDQNKIILSVADSGIGMDAETCKKCFMPFFTTKDVDQGTGLGLSVAQGIIQAHGGSVAVDSRPGKGTRFDIFFPNDAGGKQKQLPSDKGIASTENRTDE